MSNKRDKEGKEQGGDVVATYSVPSKRENRDVSVSVIRLLGVGKTLMFSRALRVDFPNPMMVAAAGLGKDHCVYLLVEEDALDKLQNVPPLSERVALAEAQLLEAIYAELDDLVDQIKGLPRYTSYEEAHEDFGILWTALDWVMHVVGEVLERDELV